MEYVICKKWFENQSLGATLKNSPTIVGTVISDLARLTDGDKYAILR